MTSDALPTTSAPITPTPGPPALGELRRRLGQVSDLHAAESLLSWEQETMMPPEAAPVRGLQLSTLAGLAHELFTDPRTGELLAQAQPQDETDRAVMRVARRDHGRATRLPTTFVEERSRAQNEAHHAWLGARKHSDFAAFAPHLSTMMDFARREADLLGFDEDPYDALLDAYEPGMRASQAGRVRGSARPDAAAAEAHHGGRGRGGLLGAHAVLSEGGAEGLRVARGR